MSGEFTLDVQTRADLGKGASRRLRRLDNKVLGIIYGGGKKKPTPILFAENEIVKLANNEAFFTSLITLNLDGKAEQVVIKDVQRHPARETFMHVDFMRVSAKTKITMHVPLHFINEANCPGVKQEGGIASHALNDLEVFCLPKDLPEFIEVDMAALNAGDNLHISDLVLPKGVESVALSHGEDHDLLVCAVNIPRGAASDDDAADEAEGETKEEGGAE
ncbi:50S ribosomal protein L25/general stress protein Ctc [Dasania marina]|uniref:50S ribosomal protein L25/general stress protein Ctc n=1 Tax=Dasania marina TaxID=471499 RepID=UPI00037FD107|nr:50S ribosomal protein L25/general stress protein Ctc [Dasania marina]